MNEDELVANLFRINQTEQKLLRENISFESKNNEDWFNEIKKLKEVKKMDMYQKRKIRAEIKKNNQEEKLTKVGINCLSLFYLTPFTSPYNTRCF